MILFISDLHGRLDLVNLQTRHALGRGHEVQAVVICGDVGLYEPILHRHFRREGGRFLRPVSYIEGNHEDFGQLSRLVDRYADVMTYLPRGSIHAIAGWRCLALGGAAYMDAIATPPGSTIVPADIQRCLGLSDHGVEVLVTHDCPSGLPIAGTPGFEHYGTPGFHGGHEILTSLRPRLWVFGHHHRRIEVDHGPTRLRGLPQGWSGYGILHADATFEFVDHEIPRPPGPWHRVRAWLSRRAGGV